MSWQEVTGGGWRWLKEGRSGAKQSRVVLENYPLSV